MPIEKRMLLKLAWNILVDDAKVWIRKTMGLKPRELTTNKRYETHYDIETDEYVIYELTS